MRLLRVLNRLITSRCGQIGAYLTSALFRRPDRWVPSSPPAEWWKGIDQMRISPRFTLEKLKSTRIEDWIDIYEDRIRGWLLDHAAALTHRPHSNAAVFQLALTYFEGWAQYRYGEDSTGRSQEFFVRALMDVFPHYRQKGHSISEAPEKDMVVRLFYRAARCGLVHDGQARQGIFFHNGLPSTMVVFDMDGSGQPNAIVINVRRFLADIGGHFERYIATLRDPSNRELRDNFARTWTRMHTW